MHGRVGLLCCLCGCFWAGFVWLVSAGECGGVAAEGEHEEADQGVRVFDAEGDAVAESDAGVD